MLAADESVLEADEAVLDEAVVDVLPSVPLVARPAAATAWGLAPAAGRDGSVTSM